MKKKFQKLCLVILAYFPFPHGIRRLLTVWGGVNIADINHVSIGQRICLDTMYPENIYIGKDVHITVGCVLLTHSLDTSQTGIKWTNHKIRIENGAFIGANTIICQQCTIGENSIIGAGSVVTKDVPANEIWAGNPARFIKSRNREKNQ